MRTYVMTVTLSAAALTLSLTLAAPAFARGGDAVERQAHRSLGHRVHIVDTQGRQTAESASGVFFDVGYSQTVETRRLKRRRWKR